LEEKKENRWQNHQFLTLAQELRLVDKKALIEEAVKALLKYLNETK
jgi:hypothetical protein